MTRVTSSSPVISFAMRRRVWLPVGRTGERRRKVSTLSLRGWVVVMSLGLVGGGLVASADSALASGPVALIGTFKIAAGTCNATGSHVAGSYFRLVFPGGNAATGQFFQNAESRCANRSYTTITGGSQGGLTTHAFQPAPPLAFAPDGDARAAAIVRPVSFAGIDLSLSTAPVDPQTGRRVPQPSVSLRSGTLSGQVEALSAAWDHTFVNQGSPKPGGRRPGMTIPLGGRFDQRTDTFVLTWTSQIVGGRFNGFFGVWHLAGTFVGSKLGTPSPGPPRPSHTATTTRPTAPPGAVARRDVDLINCSASPGGWSGGGIVTNPARHRSTYVITVAFLHGSRVIAGADRRRWFSRQDNRSCGQLWRHSLRAMACAALSDASPPADRLVRCSTDGNQPPFDDIEVLHRCE